MTIPEGIRVPLPKRRDDMVPRTPDVSVTAEILHHSLADGQDGAGAVLRLHKTMSSWVLTPSRVWQSPAERQTERFTTPPNDKSKQEVLTNWTDALEKSVLYFIYCIM